ncbi:hypothetical protein NC981_13185 [Leptolyngbya sp. DQ-M1]|uniref:hypothetical protein n=1 Tax=Leptolyngbya sp. DQ-M1 TaxID=2933920 RepID=UPI00329932FC
MVLKQRIIFIVAIALSIAIAIQLSLNELNALGVVSISGFSGLVRKRLLAVEFFALCGLYLVWLIRFRSKTIAANFAELLKPASLFLAVSWLSHPVTNDIYLYLQYGLMSLNGVNPYLTKARDFGSSLSNLVDWNYSSTYGAVSLLFFLIPAKLAEINLLLGVYGFKLICLVFHILNSYLIWRILETKAYRDKVTLAYLLSPVLLFEQVAEAHLDIFLCTVLIAIDQLLKTRRYLLALVATGIGFLTKTLPIIWIPLIGVFLIRQRRWQMIGKFLLISSIAVLVLSFTLLPSIAAWKSLVNPAVEGLRAGSWHSLLEIILMRTSVPSSTQETILTSFHRFTIILFAIYYAITLYRIYRNRSILEERLMVEIGWVTLALFTVATPWYQPWYATVLLPIAALNLQAPIFAIASFAFSLIGTAAALGLEWGKHPLGILATILTMGSPLAALLMRSKIRAFMQAKFPRETEHDPQQMTQ